MELKRFKLWFSGHLAVGTVGRRCSGLSGGGDGSSSRRDVDFLLVLGRRVESPLFNLVGHLVTRDRTTKLRLACLALWAEQSTPSCKAICLWLTIRDKAGNQHEGPVGTG